MEQISLIKYKHVKQLEALTSATGEMKFTTNFIFPSNPSHAKGFISSMATVALFTTPAVSVFTNRKSKESVRRGLFLSTGGSRVTTTNNQQPCQLSLEHDGILTDLCSLISAFGCAALRQLPKIGP